ncbi:interleukin 12Ba isoform X2 [Osmerus eperlanus]|uniref:interleukin 12Ba isoform X2 n=1 Tax=Osmerus eperlanus TaxID=29151 RepID=UPI002E133C96
MLNSKMGLSLLVVIMVTLQLSGGQLSPSYWTLLPNVVVVEVDGVSRFHHTLTCLGVSETGERPSEVAEGEIAWRRNGKEKEQRGNSYRVALEERLGGGNYSCHSRGGALLNHTTVLLRTPRYRPENINETHPDYLTCTTQNYSGEFRCSWTQREGKVILVSAARGSTDGVDCTVDERNEQWTCRSGKVDITCSVDGSGNGISCLDRKHCPYNEESERMVLTIYTRNRNHNLREYTQSFLISEIVRPDKVSIRKVNQTTVEWSYPESWNTPYSFFPLTFQVRNIRKGLCNDPSNKPHPTDGNQWSIKRKKGLVCVRSQDPLCNSTWSEWTHYNSK